MVTNVGQPTPLQRMAVNGIYLEDLIAGYRTLTVEGRESLGLDVETIEINTRDGAKYKRRRIDTRTITVSFAISDDTPEGFATKFNQLKFYLYGIEEAQLIFDDEQDKYFTGTFKKVSSDHSGRTAMTGKIEIACSDPFKYSTTEYEVAATNGTIETVYGGTYPAHPILTAQSATHDCGFYAFSNQDNYIIQVGDPEEEDQEEVTHEDDAVTVMNYAFGLHLSTNAWYSNQAHMMYDYIRLGNREYGPTYEYATIVYPDASVYDYYVGFAMGHDFGTTYANWELSITHWFGPTAAQGGGFDFYVNNANGVAICGFSVWHTRNDLIRWSVIVNNKVVKSYYCAYADNPFAAWVTTTIKKVQDTVLFNIGGEEYAVSSPAIGSSVYDASNLTWVMYRNPGDEDPAENNAIKTCLFRSIPSTWEDVANKIPANGLVEVDTGSGDITVNGTPSAGLGTINNEFENFVLKSGENTVTCEASDWVDDAVYTMKYREVFL